MPNRVRPTLSRKTSVPLGDVDNVTLGGVNALGTLEAEIMEGVWSTYDPEVGGEPVTVNSIYEYIVQKRRRDARRSQEEEKSLFYTSVLTTMTRLTKKGFLKQNRGHKQFTYAPSMSREEYETGIAQKLIEAALRISPEAAARFMVSQLTTTPPRQ